MDSVTADPITGYHGHAIDTRPRREISTSVGRNTRTQPSSTLNQIPKKIQIIVSIAPLPVPTPEEIVDSAGLAAWNQAPQRTVGKSDPDWT